MLIAFTYLPGFVTLVSRAQDLGRAGQVDASYHHSVALWALA